MTWCPNESKKFKQSGEMTTASFDCGIRSSRKAYTSHAESMHCRSRSPPYAEFGNQLSSHGACKRAQAPASTRYKAENTEMTL